MDKNNNKRPRQERIVSKATKRKKIVKKKKSKFNIFKFIRAIIIIAIVVFLIYFIFGLFFSNKKSTPVANASVSQAQEQANQVAQANATAKLVAYKNTQYNLLMNLFRFNQNLYICMGNNTAVNIYPDSQNAVKALQSNFTAFAPNLSAADNSSESAFFAQLDILNSAYISSVMAYNKAAASSTPNDQQLGTLFKGLKANYDKLNSYMNKNLYLFKPTT